MCCFALFYFSVPFSFLCMYIVCVLYLCSSLSFVVVTSASTFIYSYRIQLLILYVDPAHKMCQYSLRMAP